MLVFKKIRARCGLFRSGAVQLQSAPPRPDTPSGPTLAQVQLSTVGVWLGRPPHSNHPFHGGRR